MFIKPRGAQRALLKRHLVHLARAEHADGQQGHHG
jgi:hypothetical protein